MSEPAVIVAIAAVILAIVALVQIFMLQRRVSAVPPDGNIYDALRAKRSYKPSFSHDHATRVLIEGDERRLRQHRREPVAHPCAPQRAARRCRDHDPGGPGRQRVLHQAYALRQLGDDRRISRPE